MLGKRHPLVKRLRTLRRDREARDQAGLLVAEGIHLADEALRCGARIVIAVVSSRLRDSSEGTALLERIRGVGAEIHEAPDALLESLQDARSPQPVLLVVERRPFSLADAVRGRGGTPLLVIAHGVQDPGNLGSMLRTADAAGATGFVVTGGGADLYHPRTLRATMGSIFRLPVASSPTADLWVRMQQEGIVALAADPHSGKDPTDVDWARPTALILGGEGAGLPPEILTHVETSVRIVLEPGVESLSVGAAAAVLLFEARRRRRG